MRARALIVVCLVVGCGDNIHDADSELVRVDTEPAGANCKYGGVAIETGVDANRDGTLEDSEIQSTQYVCNGAATVQCEGGTIHEGTVTLQSSADFAQLAGVNCIDGDLIATGVSDASFPALPELSIVTGNVVIAANPGVQSLDAFASLRKVGSGVVVEANQALTNIGALGGLTSFGSISVVANQVLPDLSGFEAFDDLENSSIIVQSNPALTSLHGLESLTNIRTLQIHGNSSLTSIDALSRLRNAAIFEISGNVALPSLPLPALQTVSVRLLVNQNAALATVSLPVLTSLSDGIQFANDGSLTEVDLPALVLTGSLLIQLDPSLRTLHAPQLTFATADVVINTLPVLADVDLTHLSTIGGQLQLWNLDQLPNLSGLAGLTSLGGDLDVISCNALADFTGLGAITAVPGNMTVSTNAQLTSFGGLSTMSEVGGNLQIVSNPKLPLSVAQGFASAITVRGTTTIK